MGNLFGLKERYLDEIKILYYLFPEIDEIIIFGSRARGNYSSTSDIDIAIKSRNKNFKLYKIREILEESKIPYTMDLLHYEEIKKERFKESIDSEGIAVRN